MSPACLPQIAESGLVVVVRAETQESALRIAEACAEGGATAIEITFTVPNAARVIEELARRKSSNLVVGAGTVRDPQSARIAILSGAQFVVSPALKIETGNVCRLYRVPYFPGAGTVREVLEAMECGAAIVKVFPGEVLGPAFAKAVKAALPEAALMPTGGVSLENLRAWIRSGCVAVGVGGSLTAPAANGDFRATTDLTKRFLEEIREARG